MGSQSGVYVSLAIRSLPLAFAQEQVCSRYKLTPRSELHITLGYLGEAEDEQLASLARELAGLRRERFGMLRITGTGGVIQDDRIAVGQISSITQDTTAEEWDGCSRVLWWAVEPSEPLMMSWEVLREAILCVGLSDQCLPVDYYPHITVGSFSGPEANDQRIWDVHDIAKLPTLGRVMSPATVVVERLHITRTDLHPQSVHIIWGT